MRGQHWRRSSQRLWRPSDGSHQGAVVSEAETLSVEINGFPSRVWRKGEGPKLGFLAGFGGLPRWIPFLDVLARERTVIVPSSHVPRGIALVGHGYRLRGWWPRGFTVDSERRRACGSRATPRAGQKKRHTGEGG